MPVVAWIAAHRVARHLTVTVCAAVVVLVWAAVTDRLLTLIVFGWAAVLAVPLTGCDPIYSYATWLFNEPDPRSDRT